MIALSSSEIPNTSSLLRHACGAPQLPGESASKLSSARSTRIDIPVRWRRRPPRAPRGRRLCRRLADQTPGGRSRASSLGVSAKSRVGAWLDPSLEASAEDASVSALARSACEQRTESDQLRSRARRSGCMSPDASSGQSLELARVQKEFRTTTHTSATCELCIGAMRQNLRGTARFKTNSCGN